MHLKGNLEAFSLRLSLMGCSSLSLCRLQCDREWNIGALFLCKEMSQFHKADQKHLCVLFWHVEQRWSVMDKLSQEHEINSIQSTLESQAFIFSDDLENNIREWMLRYQLECLVIYQVTTTILLRISSKVIYKQIRFKNVCFFLN